MIASRREQLAFEPSQEREIKVQAMHTHQRKHLATETAEERGYQLQKGGAVIT